MATPFCAATARAVVAAGLHPTIGLHHSNEGNPMRLVDDLMEPFRPVIDLKVWQLQRQNLGAIDAIFANLGSHIVRRHADRCRRNVASGLPASVWPPRWAQAYLGERESLDLPSSGLPLSLAADEF